MIYLNCNIDFDWDKDNFFRSAYDFDIKTNEIMYYALDNFSLYFSDYYGKAVLKSKIDPSFFKFISLFSENNSNQVFCKESKDRSIIPRLRKLASDDINHMVTALGPKEYGFLPSSVLKNLPSIDSFRFVNNKFFLVNIMEGSGFSFPVTETISFNHALSLDKGILKYPISSGGVGVFDLSSQKDRLKLLFLQRKIKYFNSDFLLQDKLNISRNLSCFGYVGDTYNVFETKYDAHGNSNYHSLLADKTMLSDIFDYISVQLLALDSRFLHQPFGFDCIIVESNVVYPVIDLNVRVTKPHLLYKAASFFDLDLLSSVICRSRLTKPSYRSFKEFWRLVCLRLELDIRGRSNCGNFLIPLLPPTATAQNFDGNVVLDFYFIASNEEDFLIKSIKELEQL